MKNSEGDTKSEKIIPISTETQIMVIDDKNTRFSIKNANEEETTFISEDPEKAMAWVLALRSCTFDNKTPLTIDSFDIISTIGRGSYGKVMLVKMKTDGKVYAIKTVHKARLVNTRKVHTIFSERNILVKANHPFIVNLAGAFQNDSKFYLVLEYVPGGELFTYVRSQTTLSVSEARLYLAEIALALEYLHSIGVVYRDLKTENILLGKDGHIKLTDFGLSKDLSSMDVTSSFCGTNEYLAPEIIRREQYGVMVDWWTFGILTYEILFGSTPFHHPNKARMFQAITVCAPKFPQNADPDIIDFISRLLEKNPKKRATFDTLKSHKFWDGLDFKAVLAKKINPLYIPVIKENDPINFDPEFTTEPAIDSLASPVEGSVGFSGFSYNDMTDPNSDANV